MKKVLSSLIALLVFSFSNVFAQSNYTLEHFGKNAIVGSQPVAIIPETDDILHVICLGVDVNYNGEFDEGDELPSWWKISNVISADPNSSTQADLNAEKIMDFAGGGTNLFPYRCKVNNVLYIPLQDSILCYNLSTAAQLETIKIAGCKAISSDENNLYISVREYAAEDMYNAIANHVIIYNINDKTTATINTGDNVQKTIAYTNILDQKAVLAVLCEGNWGKEDSYVEFYDLTSKEQLGRFLVGSIGNDMTFLSQQMGAGQPIQMILVAVNKSNKIQILNPQTYNDQVPLLVQFGVSSEIPLPTHTVDGDEVGAEPREISYNDQAKIYLTAYDGNIYELKVADLITGGLKWGILENNGAVPDPLYVPYLNKNTANLNFVYGDIYADGKYTPGNKVCLEYVNTGSVNIEISKSLVAFPNPAKDNLTVTFDNSLANDIVSMRLSDVTGSTTQQLNFSKVADNSVSFMLNSDMPSGTYLILIETAKGNSFLKISKQ